MDRFLDFSVEQVIRKNNRVTANDNIIHTLTNGSAFTCWYRETCSPTYDIIIFSHESTGFFEKDIYLHISTHTTQCRKEEIPIPILTSHNYPKSRKQGEKLQYFGGYNTGLLIQCRVEYLWSTDVLYYQHKVVQNISTRYSVCTVFLISYKHDLSLLCFISFQWDCLKHTNYESYVTPVTCPSFHRLP